MRTSHITDFIVFYLKTNWYQFLFCIFAAKKEAGEAPYFTKKIKETTVKETEELVLECAFVGTPAPSVKWFLNEKLIQSTKDITIISDGSSSKLIIPSAMPEDTGVFTVEITNSAGSAKCFAGVNIHRKPKEQKPLGVAPRFIRRFVDAEASAGYDVSFECQVTGEEMPVVTWYFEKIEITQLMSKYEVTRKEKIGWSRLVVRNVAKEEIGQYRAVAKNSEGQASCSAYLNVTVPKPAGGKDEGGLRKVDLKAPAFAKPLRDTEVVEGDQIKLDCRLTEPLDLEVKW